MKTKTTENQAASHERGDGSVYQPTYTNRKTGLKYKSPIWWVFFSAQGRQIRLSAKTSDRDQAIRFLQKQRAKAVMGQPVSSQLEKTTFEDLADMLVASYQQKANKSLRLLPGKLRHLRTFFGDYCKARDIDGARIDAYVAARLEDGAARATVNYEVALLRRAFRLAKRSGRVAQMPEIELIAPNNARKGFFERDQFEGVMRHLPDHLKPVVMSPT
jgi:hypothetical protein